MAGNKWQVGSDGKWRISASGKRIIAGDGDPCCCMCSTKCFKVTIGGVVYSFQNDSGVWTIMGGGSGTLVRESGWTLIAGGSTFTAADGVCPPASTSDWTQTGMDTLTAIETSTDDCPTCISVTDNAGHTYVLYPGATNWDTAPGAAIAASITFADGVWTLTTSAGTYTSSTLPPGTLSDWTRTDGYADLTSIEAVTCPLSCCACFRIVLSNEEVYNLQGAPNAWNTPDGWAYAGTIRLVDGEWVLTLHEWTWTGGTDPCPPTSPSEWTSAGAEGQPTIMELGCGQCYCPCVPVYHGGTFVPIIWPCHGLQQTYLLEFAFHIKIWDSAGCTGTLLFEGTITPLLHLTWIDGLSCTWQIADAESVEFNIGTDAHGNTVTLQWPAIRLYLYSGSWVVSPGSVVTNHYREGLSPYYYLGLGGYGVPTTPPRLLPPGSFIDEVLPCTGISTVSVSFEFTGITIS